MNIDERIEALTTAISAQQINIESLHSNIHDLWEFSQKHDTAMEDIRKVIAENSEHINALVRIAHIHEQRLSDIEGASDDAQ